MDKAKAVEKHTRVRSRVVAHALRELMEAADEVFIMGHRNEDFDAIGAAMGVAKMADKLGRENIFDNITDALKRAGEIVSK